MTLVVGINMSKLPSEHVQSLLKEVMDHFDKEDVSIRERQIRIARRLKLLWEGYQRAWYSEVAHDWRIWDETQNSSDSNQAYYDKPINVFRAYLESIIAALSVTVPPIKCFPDDADSPLDIATARAGDKIAELIYRHNNVPLLWVHALFIYCTEGLVACYNYPKSDVKYGTYEEKKYDSVSENHQYATCPNCGYQLADDMVSPESLTQLEPIRVKAEQSKDEFQPDDVEVQDVVQNADAELCPNCLMMIAPELSQETLIVERIVGVTNEPKTRMCLEAYGLLYVKVANYAKKQEDTPYLIYSYETHFANVVERYRDCHDSEYFDKLKGSTGPKDPYEEWGRMNPQYQGEYPMNVITVRNAWLRPAAFNVLKSEEANHLRELYPNGVKVVFANDSFMEACNEALDDCWTLVHNPLSDYINYDPIGLLLTSIQEITNDLISLTVQTVEHGIGQTFADPGVLDFNAYRQMESLPGGIYEAIPKSGKSLGEAFHEVKTATLSPEIMPFANNIQSMAQLVSGALPSLFGGQMDSGSGTASEYSMSRAQALQRLQNVWKMFTSWWKEIFGKTIPMYINEVKTDERDVQSTKDGNFINIVIRRADLEGKLGKVELEANENLPLTWNQKKDILMKLLENQNPEILAILGSAENLPIIREAIGLNDFIVPGESDRNKQYDEIKMLLSSEPIPNPIDPMNPELPSVEIDPIFDKHNIEFEVVQEWAVSDEGRLTKIENPNGYKNVLLHGKMHFMQMQMQMMQQAQPPAEKPNQNTQTPVTGEEDVQTIQ